jgi:hypothetical protein
MAVERHAPNYRLSLVVVETPGEREVGALSAADPEEMAGRAE